MGRTLAREAKVDPGFATTGKLEACIDLSKQGYDRERGQAFLPELLARLQTIPGVRSAALGRTLPVQRSGMRTSIESDGYTPAAGEIPQADLNIVTPGFFETLGTRLVAGRDFDARDTAASTQVAIISESMARRYWPGVKNPVGRRIMNLGPPGVGGEIIGVVKDVRFRSLRRAPDPTVYVPVSQSYTPRMMILLDAAAGVDPAALRKPLADAVGALDAELPLFHVRTLEEKLGLSLGQGRLLAWLVGAFAVLALVLVATGLYAWSRTRRRRGPGSSASVSRSGPRPEACDVWSSRAARASPSRGWPPGSPRRAWRPASPLRFSSASRRSIRPLTWSPPRSSAAPCSPRAPCRPSVPPASIP